MPNPYTSWVSTMPILHVPMIDWDDFNTWSNNNSDIFTPSLISTEINFDLFSFQAVTDSSLTSTSSSPSPSGSVDSWLSLDDNSENIDTNQNNDNSNTGHLAFNTSGSLVRPYACSYCQRTFSRRHDLERHTRVHTGVKPYNCPACNKSFARSDARRRHWKSEAQCNTNHLIIDLLKKRARKRVN